MRQSIIQKHLFCVLCITCLCVSYAAAAPDLIITDLWPDGNRIHYQIQNVGNTDCPWPHATTLLIDGQYRTKDVIQETIKPGQRLNLSFEKEDFSCIGIKQVIRAIADGDIEINESSEANNIREEAWTCDQTPPQITEGPTVEEFQQGDYKVTWETNKDADSAVLYSKTTGKLNTVSDAAQNRNHTIYLYGLTEATTYQYKVRSTDLSDNTVESSLSYFTTNSPYDITSPQASTPKQIKMDQPLFPLRFEIDATDNIDVDRVAFSFDGVHFMTDYDSPFRCYVNPEDLGLTFESYFGRDHTVMAEAFDSSANSAVNNVMWAEMPRCPGMELVVELGTSTRIYTPEDNINNYLGEIQITARKNIGLEWESFGEGPHSGVASTRWEEVDEVRVYFDDNLYTTITPAVDETVLTCPLYVLYLAAPSTHEVKVEIQSGFCMMVRRATMRVIQQITDLTVERSVSRDGTGFKVDMTLTNNGTTPASLDFLTDEAEGFQITCQTMSLYDAAVSYNPTTRRSVIEYEFHCHVEGGDSRTFSYTAIPILSEGVADYRLGMNNSLGYHDYFDRYYSGPIMPAVSRVGGEHIDDAVDTACEESDYLIITNPAVLLGVYDPSSANQLLVKAAELADVRNGILGYFLGASSMHTDYRSNDKIGCGNVISDWKDEVVLMDESENEIRIYSPDRERSIGGGILPISVPGLHQNDALLVGNLMFDDDPSHPEDEIAIIDGHSSGSIRGDVTLFNYRPDHDDFEQETNNTTFDPSQGDQVIVGDMIYLDTPANRDEIVLFKGETGRVQAYYGTAAIHRQFDSIYQSDDLVAAGDLVSAVDGDEIIIGDISEQRIVIYSGEGVVLHQYSQSIQTDDTLNVSPEGLALADASEERLSLRGIDVGSDWDRDGFNVNFARGDAFLCGHVLEHNFTQYLFARGHREEHFTHGDIVIFPYSHFSSGIEPGDREHLDVLLNPGGAWADKMGDNFKDSGYLLIIGETEIIPAFSCSYYLIGNGRRYIEFTDNYYGNTSGHMKKPEISVGRIIGNTIEHMMIPIQTSLDVAAGDTELNFAEAYCFSGGPEERHETARHAVVEALEAQGWHVSRNDEPSEDTIYSHLTNIDALYMAGHGNWDHCWNVTRTNVEARFEPGRTAPIVFGSSCLTGRYPASSSTLGEHFLEYGASAYIGATEVSYSPWNRYLSEGFFERLRFDSPIGAALKGAKHNRMGDTEYGKYQSVIYHFYGDPKLEAISSSAKAKQAEDGPKATPASEDVIPGPIDSQEVSIPPFTVEHTDDGDIASIPGGTVFAEPGRPELPAWPVNIHFPAGYMVQNVDLSSAEFTSGTNLSLIEVQPEADNIIHPGPALGDPDAWPDRRFDWTTEANPDGSTTLTVYIYPLRTWPASTNYTYFNNCTLNIAYTSSTVHISRLWTNRRTCSIGEPVNIELFLYNTSQKSTHVIAEAQLVQNGAQDNTIGLPIKYLRNVQALASCGWTFDSSQAEPDSYDLIARLKSTDGRVLDEKTTTLQIGTTDGVMQPVETIPACFTAGEDIKIRTGFSNTGQTPLNPHIILEIQTHDGTVIERFEDSTTALPSNGEFLTHWEWTTSVSRGDCRFKSYTLYDGKTTPVLFYPQISLVADGDLNEDGHVNLVDFAQLAQAWLNNVPLCDIAPDGGDCTVNMLDLNIIVQAWLND